MWEKENFCNRFSILVISSLNQTGFLFRKFCFSCLLFEKERKAEMARIGIVGLNIIIMIDIKLKNRLISMLHPHEPLRIGVFGSYARGENSQESDLDLLISFKVPIGLLKLVQIQQELEDKLGLSIDLVTENSLKNPRLKRYIYKDLIEIFHEEEQPYLS